MTIETLKQRVIEYIGTIEFDFDPQEIVLLREIIEETRKEDLADITELSKKLLLRMIDDHGLYQEIDNINIKNNRGENYDPFE